MHGGWASDSDVNTAARKETSITSIKNEKQALTASFKVFRSARESRLSVPKITNGACASKLAGTLLPASEIYALCRPQVCMQGILTRGW